MIAPMEKLVLAGPKGRAKELLQSLQGAGVVHLETLRVEELAEYRLSPGEREELRRWEAVAAGAEHSLALLGREAEPARPFPEGLEAAERALAPIQGHAEGLSRQKQELEEELALAQAYLEPLGKLAALAQGLDQSPFFRVLAFLLTEKELPLVEEALKRALEDRFLLATEAYAKGLAALLVVHRKDLEAAKAALSRAGMAELRLPGAYGELPLSQAAQRLKERAEAAPQELSEVRQALFRLAAEATSTLQSLWTRAKDEVARLKALEELASGRFGFALLGYVPVKAKGRVEEALARHKDGVVYAFEPVDEHHEADRVPVALDNPPWVRPFELLVSFLNTPKYGSLDPTPVVPIFFPFWFGMIVGDIGYALLFLLLGRWLSGYVKRNEPLVIDLFALKLKPPILSKLVYILNWMVFWTVVWGVVYGEFFGTFLEHLGVFGTPEHPGLIPILIHRIDTAKTANLLILLSVAFGVVMVFWGLLLRAYLGLKHHHMAHFWEGVGYLGGLVGILALAAGYLGNLQAGWLTALMYLGFAVFFLSVLMSRIWLMIPEIFTQAGHILSHIRIYAVGAAGGILAGLLTDVGFAMAERLGLIGALLGLAVAALLHLLILLLTTLGHMLQPIRLIWVEFFTKFGFYEENGRPYRPFKSVRETQ
ncbi:MAG: V-type ATP synthase subunit I [Thermus sp.]|uniref:V-type ATP synthase subunit I n=1 Tax=Thermus sp. TaxID=275 RepID=UPI0025F6D72D|nr:V-type ATPase 116kDa subunit family protein [Thermus sp.]MCS7217632.1 V-type ATP synthase subunit I [Thermus sp.]MDW8017155.1 V-type ATPase 116kDa subunit family protein [Thermus sp.]